MSDKNVTWKRYNGSSYDTLYPKTTIRQVTNLQSSLDDKQATLVSGTNIKTINNNSVLGSGNIDVDALPSQSGHSGEYLTTDGTDASWGAIDISAKEDVANKVTSLSASSTDTQYPSAKVVYDTMSIKPTIVYSAFEPTTKVEGDYWIDEKAVFSITPTLTNVTGSSSNPTTITEGKSATLTFTANSGYKLPDLISVSDNVAYTYAKDSGTVVLSNPTGNVSITIVGEEDIYSIPLCFTANTDGSTISMSVTGTPTWGQNFSYSANGTDWNTFTPDSTTVTLTNAGDKVYFKGNNPNGVSQTDSIRYKFVMTGSIAASGNIMSLIDNAVCTTATIPNSYCFTYLFYNCTSLTTAPGLPATTLTERCYECMFYGCSSLTAPPALPATILKSRCYCFMFSGCTGLTTVPALPATTLVSECYASMFRGCTSLQVNDSPVQGTAEQTWTIPTSGTFTDTLIQYYMFYSCPGSRASGINMPGEQGKSYTYYTQNTPV